MNKKGFIIIWDWRFFVFIGVCAAVYFGYVYLVDGGLIGDSFGQDLIDYKINPRIANLNYGSGKISYPVYAGLDEYFSNVERSISYSEGSAPPTTKDFIMKEINDDLQYQALMPLVWEIRSKARTPKDEANMAIKMVQNIPYDYDALYSVYLIGRYPYEVIYDNKGVCGEKSELLAFLLKELGYDVVIFEFNAENHRAVGILCDKGNYKTNYCFIESTEPTAVGYIPPNYVGNIDIRNAKPEIVQVSKGRKYEE